MDDPGPEEGCCERLGELEVGAGDIAHFDGAGGVGYFCFFIRSWSLMGGNLVGFQGKSVGTYQLSRSRPHRICQPPDSRS